MIIDNLDSLRFNTYDDETSGLVTIEVIDTVGDTVIGTFRIAKTRSIAFLDSLKVICREIHNTFETNHKATTRFDNQTSGTLEFREA